jgi:hypothetical protein
MGKQGRARNAKLRVDCSIGDGRIPQRARAEETGFHKSLLQVKERESRAKAVIMS